MRRNLVLTLSLAAVVALAIAAIAGAASTKIRAGNLIVTFGGSSSPSKLSKTEYTPAKPTFFGSVVTSDGTHPSAAREAFFDIDKDVKVTVKGLPVCKASQLTARNTAAAKQVCGDTIVGSGIAHAEIAFPEQKPIIVASPITIFNGGGTASNSKLLIHTFITVPVPAAIVTQVTIAKRGTGIHTVTKIPVIAGGSGSAIDFRFTLGRNYTYKGKRLSYSMGKCPDGVFKTRAPKIVFKNEAKVPGVPAQTILKGGLTIPCTPKG
jgi:hypothetical protein